MATVTEKKEMHTDEISSLKWIKDPKSTKKKFLVIIFFFRSINFILFKKLLSTSKDGKILIWNALPTKNQLKLMDGFLMLNDFLTNRHLKSYGSEMSGI